MAAITGVLPTQIMEMAKNFPEHLISLFFLGLARILPVVVLAPFFGARLMPAPARVAFSIALFLILLPGLLITVPPLDWSPGLISYFIKETAVGFFIGFLVTIPFNIAQMSGIVIDFQRGSSSLTGQDITTGTQVSSNGILYNSMLIVIFFWLDGPFIFLDALFKSYTILPPDQFPAAEFFLNGNSVFWQSIIGIMAKMFALACQLAAPSLLTILMTDTFLGIINRLAQQVQISFLGQGLKAFFGDFALWLAWFFILDQLGKMSLNWLSDLTSILVLLKP
ncbi:MAG: flagellar biosynthetic protein FliR [Chlamydiota bacterium]